MKHGPLALQVGHRCFNYLLGRPSTQNLTYLFFQNKQQPVIHARKGRLCSKGDAASVCPSASCRVIVIEVPQVSKSE